MDTIDKHPVKGGNQQGRIVHIGRTSYQGEVPIGKIWTDSPLKAPLYFPTSGQEKNTDVFQALIYEPSLVTHQIIEMRAN